MHTTEHKVLPLVSWQLRQGKFASILRGWLSHQKKKLKYDQKEYAFLGILKCIAGYVNSEKSKIKERKKLITDTLLRNYNLLKHQHVQKWRDLETNLLARFN